MRAAARRAEIERILSVDREAGVDGLAKLLGVTSSTIRRDLTHLTNQGVITRTYGGAVIAPSQPHELSLSQRAQQSGVQKDAIGRWAAAQILEGETVILDAGTTVGRVAHHLRTASDICVITNGLTSLITLADVEEIDLVVLGGELRQISQGLVGPLSEAALMRLSADRVFLGADGLTANFGICEASTVQTRLKEVMMARSQKIYVLADSRKLGQAPFDAWAPIERAWTLVTDDGATEELLAPFRALTHVEIVMAPTGMPTD